MKDVAAFKERLAEALGDIQATTLAGNIGLSKQAISMYLSGKRKPKRPTVKAIAEELNVNETWLLGFDVPKERNIVQLFNEKEKATLNIEQPLSNKKIQLLEMAADLEADDLELAIEYLKLLKSRGNQ